MRKSPDARLANLIGALSLGLSDRVLDATTETADLGGAASTALIALLDFSRNGSVRALSEVVGLTHSGAVRLVDRLAAAGYVERSAGSNARSLAIALTPAGVAVANKARAARHTAIASTFAHLDAGQRALLTELCESLVREVTRDRLEQRAAGHAPPGGALCRMCDFKACGRERGLCPAAQTAASQFAP